MSADRFEAVNRGGTPARMHPPDDRELEARLDKLLADPTVRLLMERDGLEREVLLGTIRLARRRIAEARRARPGPGPSDRFA